MRTGNGCGYPQDWDDPKMVIIMHLSMLSPKERSPGICGAFDFSEEFSVKIPTFGK